MECTQRLECTQELYSTQIHTERICPEQIGFLGICGKKYPLKKGPNKIGRDPQTCNIVLNLNSISRQHAVINILSKKDFMLMDLDSANKTKLSGKSLQPYIPHPLHNGDTVQFGEIFGIFRLLEEEDDLPMTQAIHIPDTPVPTKHMSRINAVTTIPESPDVSDKDDSIIVPSQPKRQQFTSSQPCNFIKPGKTISIQPVGTNKIDNIYWNSTKKSTSLNLNDSYCSLNDSVPPLKLNDKGDEVSNNTHELKTLDTYVHKEHTDSTDSIYTANTQIPDLDNLASIHTANTQLPVGTNSTSVHSLNTQIPCGTSPSIHTLDTQIPSEYLPEVCKINDQHDMQFDLCPNKDMNDIHSAETQMFPAEKENIPIISHNNNDLHSSLKSNHKLDVSNEEVIFDEIDDQLIEKSFESQAILSEDIDLPVNKLVEPDIEFHSQIIKPKSAKRNMRIKSDSSTDCEDLDILPTQKIFGQNADDDATDCEDLIELNTDSNETDKVVPNKSAENFQDMPTQVIELDEEPLNTKKGVDIEDMPTQVIELDEEPLNTKKGVDIEDMPTQVLIDIIDKDAITVKNNLNTDLDFEDLPTQVLDEDLPFQKQPNAPRFNKEEDNSPFKIPFTSPLKAKKKDTPKHSKTPKIKPISVIDNKTIPSNANNDRYYQNTQDIYEDLCTQKVDSPNVKSTEKVGMNIPSTENEQSLHKLMLDASISSIDAEEKVCDYVSNLSSQDIRNMIGVDSDVCLITKVPSDGSTTSDVEVTPKKMRSFRFMDIDLPDSQEIKTSVWLSTKSMVTESSSDSETENNSEEQCTPILFRKKKKTKPDAKIDLIKKFEIDTLPSRVITRVRKPTIKLQDHECKKASENILKPKFLTEQECEIDKEIIIENISRLKSKNEKSKNVKSENDGENDEKDKIELAGKGISSVHNPEETKYGTNKIEKIKMKESKNSQKELIDPKDQSSIANYFKKQVLDSTVDAKNKTISSSKSKNTLEVGIIEKCAAVNVKKECNSRKNIDEDGKEKLELSSVKTKDSKDEKRKKRETKSTQKELKDSKKQSSAVNNNTKQSLDSTAGSKDKTRLSDKSKEIETFDLTESPVETKRSTRSTRNAKAKDTNTKTENKSASPEEKRAKRKYTKKQPKQENRIAAEKEMSPVKEVRRSKRQRNVKEEKEDKAPKSILKKSSVPLEESAVYNMSSSSNSDTSRTFKRPALDDSVLPSSKRPRSVVNNTSLRATPARMAKTQYVLFTAFPFETVKVKLEKLGAVVVTDITKSTLVLTRQIKRTFKLLCAVGLGKPIVGPSWVQACVDTNTIVDPWLYLMKDEAAEKRFNFSLEQTLKGRRNFLKGYNVSSTPSVLPDAREMKLIVECSGGTWKEGGPQWVCVSVPNDIELWPSLRGRGATIVSTEFILGGVLRQKVEINANKYK